MAIETRYRIKARRFFRWYDLWIGAYIDTEKGSVYICPLPTIGVELYREEYALCPECNSELRKCAHWTGDGWLLYWECQTCYNEDDTLMMDWPFGDRWLSGYDLEDYGYELV